MTVREILRRKRTGVVTVGPETAVHEAMRVLVRHNIGALVVMTEGTIEGILTERDLLRAGAENPQRLLDAVVKDLMTSKVITAPEDVDLVDVMRLMSERRIRHLPITVGGELCGMISIGDVVESLRQSTEAENRYLHAYITGTPL